MRRFLEIHLLVPPSLVINPSLLQPCASPSSSPEPWLCSPKTSKTLGNFQTISQCIELCTSIFQTQPPATRCINHKLLVCHTRLMCNPHVTSRRSCERWSKDSTFGALQVRLFDEVTYNLRCPLVASLSEPIPRRHTTRAWLVFLKQLPCNLAHRKVVE